MCNIYMNCYYSFFYILFYLIILYFITFYYFHLLYWFVQTYRNKSDLDSQTDGYRMNSVWMKKNVCTTTSHLWHVRQSRVVTLFWVSWPSAHDNDPVASSFWGLWPFRRMTTTILSPRRQFVWYGAQSNSVVGRIHPSYPNEDTPGRDVRRVAKDCENEISRRTSISLSTIFNISNESEWIFLINDINKMMNKKLTNY